MIAPTFESLATKYAKPNRITFAKVDVDNQQEVARQYGVRAMPTFLILRNGSVIDTIQGANPPALTAAVEKAVKLATAAAPGAVFSSPGRTLGADTAAASSGAGRSTGSTRSTAARPPAAGPTLGRRSVWDLNSLVNALIAFFGLYFTSLFSVCSTSSCIVHSCTYRISTNNYLSYRSMGTCRHRTRGSTSTTRRCPSTRLLLRYVRPASAAAVRLGALAVRPAARVAALPSPGRLLRLWPICDLVAFIASLYALLFCASYS